MNDLKALWNKIPAPVRGALIILMVIVAIIILVMLFKQIKKLLRPDVDWSNVPVVGYDDQGNPINWNPDELASDLYNCMKGLNLFTCSEYWEQVADLQTDDMVRLLADHYETNYGEGSTLYQWINGEWTDGGGKKEAALARLTKAGRGS